MLKFHNKTNIKLQTTANVTCTQNSGKIKMSCYLHFINKSVKFYVRFSHR